MIIQSGKLNFFGAEQSFLHSIFSVGGEQDGWGMMDLAFFVCMF